LRKYLGKSNNTY